MSGTGVSPHRLHVVVRTDEEGIPVDLPLHNVRIWQKQ